MSQKLEQILELLISEDNAKAEELLHEYVVSKARSEYESILDEADDEEVDEEENEEVDEDINRSNDFENDVTDVTDEIGDDESEIDSDEFAEIGDEVGDEFGGEDDGMEVDLEDKVDDLEAELAELKADFDALMNDEMGEPEHDDLDLGGDDMDMDDGMGDELGGEEELESFNYNLDSDVVREATNLQNKVSQQHKTGGMKGSEADASNSKSPFTTAPKPTNIGTNNVTPVRINDGSEGSKGLNKPADKTPTSNIKVVHKASPIQHKKSLPNSGDDRSNAKSPIPKK